jgi:tRNA-specific 2-thiouridylase
VNTGVVAVAMSGGVDSSLTALLLAEQGWQVVGFTLLLHDEGDGVNVSPRGRDRRCCHLEGAERARQAALRAGGEHHVLDVRAAFREAVIADFEREYARGRTPNPCVRCNTFLKWGLLYEHGRRLGASMFATGHHARVRIDQEGERGGPRHRLLRARDPEKDQSYALWGIPRSLLPQTLLPVGELTKREVRALAAEHGLAAAGVPDSQEICFVPGDYRDFLAGRVADGRAQPGLREALEPGDIVDGSGRVLGRHEGTARYTIGQRRGLGVATGRPLFVEGIDPVSRTVRVGEGEGLLVQETLVEEANWVSSDPPKEPLRAQVHIRYNDPGAPAEVRPLDARRFTVRFDLPQRAVTPGQSAVIYQGEVVLGGGVIAG